MTKPVDKNSLDKIATQYHLNNDLNDKEFDEKFHEACFSWISTKLSKEDSILEMGFGEGNVTSQLLNLEMDVEIIEGSKLLVDEAKQRFKGQARIHHSLFSDFQPSKNYSYILATNILEHVENPIETLDSISNWCSKDTKVVITVPNSESIHRRLAVLMGIQPKLDSLSSRDKMVGHHRVYNYDRLIKDISCAGFKVIESKGFQLKVLPNSMMLDFSDSLTQAMYDISNQIDFKLLANIAVIIQIDR